MQFAKKSKNIYSYAFLIMMYDCTYRCLYIRSGPYQFFPGKYIWVFYFPSYDLIISVFFIQLYKINFFHIVFVIHIVALFFGTWRFVVFIGIQITKTLGMAETSVRSFLSCFSYPLQAPPVPYVFLHFGLFYGRLVGRRHFGARETTFD